MNKLRLAEQLIIYLESLYPERSSISVHSLDEINMGWETELYTFEVDSTKDGEQIKEHRVLRVFQGDGAGAQVSQRVWLDEEPG